MRQWLVWGAVLPACALALAQTPSAENARPSSPIVPDAVLRALGSTDFAERNAAQKRLDDIPLHQRDALEQLAASIADPEVRARLLARVDAIDDELAINPLPISLDVKDVSPQQLAQALAKSLKLPLHATVSAAHATDHFTLSVKDAPFWDVFYQLHKQNPITFNRDAAGGGWILYDDGGKADTPLELDKGFLVEVSRAMPRALSSSAVRLVAGAGGGLVVVDDAPHSPGGLAVTFRVTADPRINVQSLRFQVRPDLHDDEGHPLTVVSAEQNAAKARDISWAATALIGTPAEVGKSIKALQVTAVMIAAVDTQSVIVDHPEEMLAQPIQVGGTTLKIRQFSGTATRAAYTVALSGDAVGVSVCVIDGTGDRIACSDAPLAGVGEVTASAAGQPPFRLELSAARSMKEVILPMEWHDIPIDGKPAAGGSGVVIVPAAGGGFGGEIRIDGPVLQVAPATQPQRPLPLIR